MATTTTTTAMNDSPIIVFGCPRSGTTLVQLILHSHPNISVSPETRFLVSAYRRRLEFGDLRKEREPPSARRLHHARDAASASSRSTGRRRSPRSLPVRRRVGSATGIVFRAYARKFGAVRWGSKFPSYHRDLAAIRRMFPDAQLRQRRSRPALCRRLAEADALVEVEARTCRVATWAQALDHAREAKRRWPDARARDPVRTPARRPGGRASGALRRARRGVRPEHARDRTVSRMRFRLGRNGRRARGSRSPRRRSPSGRLSSSPGRSRSARRCSGAGCPGTATSRLVLTAPPSRTYSTTPGCSSG